MMSSIELRIQVDLKLDSLIKNGMIMKGNNIMMIKNITIKIEEIMKKEIMNKEIMKKEIMKKEIMNKEIMKKEIKMKNDRNKLKIRSHK